MSEGKWIGLVHKILHAPHSTDRRIRAADRSKDGEGGEEARGPCLKSFQERVKLLHIIQATLGLTKEQILSCHTRERNAAVLVQARTGHLACSHLFLEVLVAELSSSLDIECAIPAHKLIYVRLGSTTSGNKAYERTPTPLLQRNEDNSEI